MPLVALVHELVGARDAFETIDVVEFGRDLVAKEPAGTSRAHGPCTNFLRIAPDQVTKGTFVWNLLRASNNTNLVESADFRTEATVHAKNFAIDQRCEGKEVKDLAGCLPHRRIAVLLLTLFVEAIHLGDLAGFVVPSNERDSVWISWKRQRTGRL